MFKENQDQENWAADFSLRLLILQKTRLKPQAQDQKVSNFRFCSSSSSPIKEGSWGLLPDQLQSRPASWWWQRCHSHSPQGWNSVEIGSPELGVLTLGIRIHNRMGRERNKLSRYFFERHQGDGKHNCHLLKNPLTLRVFSQKGLVCFSVTCLFYIYALYLSPEDLFLYIFIFEWAVVVFSIILSHMSKDKTNVGYENFYWWRDVREMVHGEKLLNLKQQHRVKLKIQPL